MDKLAGYLQRARQIFVITGAGISTASGIPDFRGPQGVWSRRKPVYYQEFMTSEAARAEHWDYKVEAWSSISEAQPNAVHRALVQLEKADKILMVVTQNIDGLHSLAGTSRDRLVELHGTNSLVECQTCHRRGDPRPHLESFRANHRAPLCQLCQRSAGVHRRSRSWVLSPPGPRARLGTSMVRTRTITASFS